MSCLLAAIPVSFAVHWMSFVLTFADKVQIRHSEFTILEAFTNMYPGFWFISANIHDLSKAREAEYLDLLLYILST